jgi:ATP-dependent helicase/nuclease subunit B
MALVREFLGWHRSGLAAAVDWLKQRYADETSFELGNVTIALPGARAGRRLLELLVERAEAESLVLEPPRILTVGSLPECLYKPVRPLASSLARQWAWVAALIEEDPTDLARLFFQRPANGDWPRWLALADLLDELHTELGREGRDFNDVAAHRNGRAEAFIDAPRWHGLARLQAGFLDQLQRAGLADTQAERLRAIHEKACLADFDIVLVAAADLPHVVRQMLDQVADRVTALVIAPQELSQRFGPHGDLSVDAWQNVTLDLRTEQVQIADGPSDQAMAVLGRIASWQGRYAAEQITVGVPDRNLAPFIQQQLAEADLPSRYVDGLPMSRTGPYRLLEAVADYLETKHFAALVALVRHPDVESRLAAWLSDHEFGPEFGVEPGEWLSELDQYYRDHLPVVLNARWLGTARRHSLVKRVCAKIEKWLEALYEPPRRLADWAPSILELVLHSYSFREWDRHHPNERMVVETCDAIRKALSEQQETAAIFAPKVSASEALRLTLRQIDGLVPPLPDEAAIELLGWLELPLDDAPALIVTGFNDGLIPAAVNADSFLPNSIRRELKLLNNDQRYARDAYAMSVLLASREDVTFVSGRRTSNNDPLLPSRLMFACDGPTVVERVGTFFHAVEEGSSGTKRSPAFASPLVAGQQESKFIVPRPLKLIEPVTALRVTEFKSYLSCPYRYYLRHRLGLESLDDSADELDPGAFGSLAHEVLNDFGRGPGAIATDVETVRAHLNEALDRLVAERYGGERLAAISVQVEQFRARMGAFAEWQAERAKEGWRIESTERKVEEEQAPLEVDGVLVYLHARIDRIDVHDATGRRMIFDYKTSDTAKSPEATHRRKDQWIDLQLPLYAHIARRLGIAGDIQLGYINLSKDLTKVDASLAEWNEAHLNDAIDTARQVVRDIRNGKFWPPASPPPDFSEDLAAICQDGQFGGRAMSEPEEGEE